MQKQRMIFFVILFVLTWAFLFYYFHFTNNNNLFLTFTNFFLNDLKINASQAPPPPLLLTTPSTIPYLHCNLYKNQTIINNLQNITFNKTFLQLPNNNNLTLQIFHYGKTDFISRALMNWHSWENEFIAPLIKIMQQDMSLNFIDIGSNLGVYALTVASLGRKVVAVEAMEETCQRNYASIWINKFQNQIVLVQNALSDFRGKGASGVVDNGNFTKVDSNKKFITTMQFICMDDLLEVITFNRSIVKIDIEGSEYRALFHAKELFHRIDIPLVLFEWDYLKRNPSESVRDEVIYFFMSRGYRPFSSLETKIPDLTLFNNRNWKNTIIWKKEPYL